MKIISIVGPTASGKSALAIKVAEHFLKQGRGVDYVSLDARQIYREFPVLSGAEVENLPRNNNFRYYNLLDKNIDEEFSLGLLARLVQEIVTQAEAANRQVLLVGGTLLYHQRVLENNDLTQVPPDDNVRFAAENMTVTEIQAWLQKVNQADFASLNESDRQNPRRLVRKLEIAIYQKTHGEDLLQTESAKQREHVYLQPKFNLDDLPEKITKRVQERFTNGALEEVKAVINKNAEVLSSKQWLSRMPLGFVEIARYLAAEITAAECQELWVLHEWQYAKRQMTFLKKLLFDHHADLIDEREILTD